jgi:hypothetical protein
MKKILLILLLFVTSTAYSQLIPFGYYTNSVSAAMVTLIAPANTSTGQSQTPEFSWNEEGLATTYQIQVANVSNFSSDPLQWDTTVVDTSLVITQTLDEGSKWYWRVRFNTASDTSSWSAVYSFTVTEGSPIARTYYVDATDGLDANNGRDESKAWKTLAQVSARTFIPGDTILLKGGETFPGGISNVFTDGDTTIGITYGSYGTGKAKILLASSGAVTDGININYSGHIKVNISNIIIEGVYNPVTMSGGGTLQRGIFVWNWTTIYPLDSNKVSQVNISNCEISKVKNTGIQITPGDFGKTVACKIDSNLVYDVGKAGIAINFNWHSKTRIYANKVYNVYGDTSQVYTNAIAVSLCKDITIERNLVHTVGYHSKISGLGIVSGASKDIKIRYNVITAIYSNTAHDGEAIDLENGTDSSLVEHNYIYNIPGNAILISWGTSDGSIKTNYKAHILERGSLDSGNSNDNVIRYNVIKNFGTNDTAGIPGIYVPVGWVDTLDYELGKNNQVYNNTIVTTYETSHNNAALGLIGRSDSSKMFNNLVLSNTTFMWASLDGASFDGGRDSLRNAYIDNNMFWSPNKSVQFVKVRSTILATSTISGWNNLTSYESTRYLYNPLLNNPYDTTGDAIDDPFLIETLIASKYTPVDASMTNKRGAEITSYVLSTPETDIVGNPVKVGGYYGIGAVVNSNPTPYAYQEETKKWLGRQDVQPTEAQMKNKDSLIVFLKADTLLSKFDIAYLLADTNSYSATRNILSDTFNITPTNSPTFTAWSGFAGISNGVSSSYLRTNWYPSGSATNFTLNSSALSVYSNTNLTDAEYIYGVTNGTDVIQLYPLVAGGLRNWINQPLGTFTIATNTTSKGMFVMSRTGSTTLNAFVNDSLLQSLTTSSTAIPSTYPLYLLSRNFSGGVSGATTREISFFGASSGLTEYQQHRLTDNIEWYLTAIGQHKAPVKPILDQPANASIDVSTTVTFEWEKLNNARYYQLQTSYLSNFGLDTAIVGDVYVYDSTQYTAGTVDTIDDLRVIPIKLLNNRQYYWRVRGVNKVDVSGNGAWSSVRSFFTPTNYEAESVTLFSRMSYPPSDERKDLMDSLVKIMKADGSWATSDLLYMTAATDTGMAKYNWISANYDLVNSGARLAIFESEKGYKSQDTGYLRTNWRAIAHGINYTKDNGSYSFFSQDNIAENKFVMGANNFDSLLYMQTNPRTTANNIQSYLNSSTVSNVSNSNSQGFFTLSRDNSANYQIYRNGALLSSVTMASSNVPTSALAILGTNFDGGYSSFTTRRISFVRVGASLTADQENTLSRRVEWYLNRIHSYPYAPSKPILLSPEDAETGVGATPELDWDNVGADIYQIQVSSDSLFATTVVDEDVSGSEFLLSDWTIELLSGVYYWRVRGTNAIDVGTWSDTLSFNTEAGGGGGGGLTYPTFIDNMYSYWRIKLNEIPTTNLKAFKPF